MLLQFSVENFKSFKERAVLSLEASSDRDLPYNVVRNGKDKYLKSAVIFGANASGKSNLLQAMSVAVLLVRQSNRQCAAPLENVVPFRFDDVCANKPSFFEFVFCANGKKYIYGFSVTNKKVMEEYLYVYNSSRASVVFERTETDKYRFTSYAIRKNLLPLVEQNAENQLFLATASCYAKEAREAYQWFEQKIHMYSSDCEQLLEQTMSMFVQDDHSLHQFVHQFFRGTDINIYNYEVTSSLEELKIETIHRVENDGRQKYYRMHLLDEAKGVKWLLAFASILKQAFETGGVIYIDDFGAGLHPLLVKYLISLFHDPEVNEVNAQLIVSTQVMELLSSDVLRRDQIYFVEKDVISETSELYSLDDFEYRKGEDYLRMYLQGRYGAAPFIDDTVQYGEYLKYVLWQEGKECQ